MIIAVILSVYLIFLIFGLGYQIGRYVTINRINNKLKKNYER
jgi:uncharacterized protein YneF (UPF0154 family)